MTQPIPTATLACQAIAAANCRLVNPSAFKRARSVRRRRTEETRVRPSATTAPQRQGDAEQDRRRSERAVVEDLGRPLDREDGAAVTSDLRGLVHDRLQRGQPRLRVGAAS